MNSSQIWLFIQSFLFLFTGFLTHQTPHFGLTETAATHRTLYWTLPGANRLEAIKLLKYCLFILHFCSAVVRAPLHRLHTGPPIQCSTIELYGIVDDDYRCSKYGANLIWLLGESEEFVGGDKEREREREQILKCIKVPNTITKCHQCYRH